MSTYRNENETYIYTYLRTYIINFIDENVDPQRDTYKYMQLCNRIYYSKFYLSAPRDTNAFFQTYTAQDCYELSARS